MRSILMAGMMALLVGLLGCTDTQDSQDVEKQQLGVLDPQVDRPDLIVTELEVTSWTPMYITYSYTIKNIGLAPANLDGPTDQDWDNVGVQAYLSNDTIYGNAGDVPAGGTILGLSPLGYLDPGETFSGSFSATPNAAPCSKPYLVLKVDDLQVVSESNEYNNTLATRIDICGMRIDIKPGSDPNPINLKSKGVIPVAILGSAYFDVADIDETTIAFGPAGAPIAHRHAHLGDVNTDGFMDMVVHFRTQETGIEASDSEACLTATLQDGRVFTACDGIVMVSKDTGETISE